MAKEPIWWHRERLTNSMEHQRRQVADLERLQQKVAADQASIERLQQQIERAVREGRDGFDADRFEPKKGGG